jgi:hypothetical protein
MDLILIVHSFTLVELPFLNLYTLQIKRLIAAAQQRIYFHSIIINIIPSNLYSNSIFNTIILPQYKSFGLIKLINNFLRKKSFCKIRMKYLLFCNFLSLVIKKTLAIAFGKSYILLFYFLENSSS